MKLINKNNLINLLPWLFTVLIVVFLQNVMAPYFMPQFNVVVYTILFLLTIGLIIAYYLLENKTKKLNIPILLIIILGSFFIINLIGTLCVPSESNFTFAYTDGTVVTFKYVLGIDRRIYFILCGLFVGFLPIIIFYILPRFITMKHVKYVLYLAIAFFIFTILFSLIKEFDKYVYIVKHLFVIDVDPNQRPVSIFGHRNMFAIYMTVIIFIFIFFNSYKPRWYFYLIIFFLLVLQLFTLSKTSLLSLMIIIPAYLIWRFIFTYKEHKDRNIITLLVSSFVIFMGGILFVLLIGRYPSIKEGIAKLFSDAQNTFKSRSELWHTAFSIMSPVQYIFGFGIGAFNAIIPLANSAGLGITPLAEGVTNPHNLFVHTIGQYGILGLLLYLAIYVYLIRLLIKNRKLSYPYFITTIFLLIYLIVAAMFESFYLFFEVSYAIFVPLFIYIKNGKKSKHKKRVNHKLTV